jgi:glycine/D-amino acid oxidase-like deaminating enzyme
VRWIAPTAQGEVIGSDAYHGGLVVEDAAAVHPARLHAGLRRAVRAAGGALVAKTAVHAFARETHGFELFHDIGEKGAGETWAREVVVATGGHVDAPCDWRRRRVVPVGSYMVATEPLAADHARALSPLGLTFCDTRRLPAYFRLSPDGRRLLFGGRASRPDLPAGEVALRLGRAMLRVFPQLHDVRLTHAWGGRLAFTRDRLPHLARHEGVLHVAGCQGAGVAMATWLGHQAARTILAGTTSAFAAPLRALPLSAGTPWFVPLIASWCRLRDALER